ncbi:MAG: nitrate reductase [Cyanobacteria bacterium P01_F01_bin.42]
MTTPVKTLCPYCGVGCGLEVQPPAVPNAPTSRDENGNLIWRVKGDRAHPSSQGQVCIKGATIAASLDKDRLKYPMIRSSLDQEFRRASWEEVYRVIADRIQYLRENEGPDSICMYGSGQFQTEDYYTAQKLLKGCIGTNNFDANSRLCMSSAVAGYIQSLGSDGPPTCYDDLEQTDCAFLIGTNAADCHPIAFNRLKRHHKKNRNVKMIVVDPRKTATADVADLHLAIRPGTDMHLLNGIAHLLMRWNMYEGVFIDECTQGFIKFAQVIQHYPPELVARECGIRIDELEQAAELWGKSKRVLSLWSMGVNQSSEGTAKVRTIINLHLMTGNIGRPGAGPFSLTGQPNAMGGREAGGLSHILPGYRLVKNPEHRAALEEAWKLPEGSINPVPGRSAWEMIEGLEQGQVGLLWVAATNPVVSMPDIERTKAAMEKSPLTICQDAYYPTETAHYAHILLPAAQWGEKTGVMTNSERMVTLCPAFRDPVGEAKADWEIFAEVGRRIGFEEQFSHRSSAEVYAEFVSVTRDRLCDVTGLSHERLAELGPVQWPFPDSCAIDPSNPPQAPFSPIDLRAPKRLYEDLKFATPNGLAQFSAFHAKGLAEPPDARYPFVLTTGRLYGHWHTMTRTGRIPRITKSYPKPFLEIHPRDAKKIGVEKDGRVEMTSARGRAVLDVKITKAITPGTVFMPMHWGFLWAEDAEVNALTHPKACPISLEPELKACAVNVVPVADTHDDSSVSEDRDWNTMKVRSRENIPTVVG